jgi:hypothetical protein
MRVKGRKTPLKFDTFAIYLKSAKSLALLSYWPTFCQKTVNKNKAPEKVTDVTASLAFLRQQLQI